MADKSRKQQIEEMLAEDPNDPFLRYGLAMEHVSAGQDEEAVRCFQGLLQVAPDYVPAYMQAGRVLTRLNREDEARELIARESRWRGRRGTNTRPARCRNLANLT